MNAAIANDPAPAWVVPLFAAVDAKDAAGFATYFTAHGRFVYGSGAPVTGRQAVEAYVADFLNTLDNIRHTVLDTSVVANKVFIEVEVTYGLRGGRRVTLPAFVVAKMDGARIREYRIYIDPTPMALPAAHAEG